tara:strand:- start:5882 stop:7345 length:1464 start_codon:yes stop_codon:yes gene_type:complete
MDKEYRDMDIDILKEIYIGYHQLDIILSNVNIDSIKDIPEGDEYFINGPNHKKGGMFNEDDEDNEDNDIPDFITSRHLPGSQARAEELGRHSDENIALIREGYPPKLEFKETFDIIHEENDTENLNDLRNNPDIYPRYRLYAKLKNAITKKHTACVTKIEGVENQIKNNHLKIVLRCWLYDIVNRLFKTSKICMILSFLLSYKFLGKLGYNQNNIVTNVYDFYQSYYNDYDILTKLVEIDPVNYLEGMENIKQHYVSKGKEHFNIDIQFPNDFDLSEEDFIEKYFTKSDVLTNQKFSELCALAYIIWGFAGFLAISGVFLYLFEIDLESNIVKSFIKKTRYNDTFESDEYRVRGLTNNLRENPRRDKWIKELLTYVIDTQNAWVKSQTITIPNEALRKVYQIDDLKREYIFQYLRPSKSEGLTLVVEQLLKYDYVDVTEEHPDDNDTDSMEGGYKKYVSNSKKKKIKKSLKKKKKGKGKRKRTIKKV